MLGNAALKSTRMAAPSLFGSRRERQCFHLYYVGQHGPFGEKSPLVLRDPCIDASLPAVTEGQRYNSVIHVHNRQRTGVGRAPESPSIFVRFAVAFGDAAERASVEQVTPVVRVLKSLPHESARIRAF